MKKQQKTTLLLLLVLAIWGVLGFKIVSSLSPDAPELSSDSLENSFTPVASVERDTFSIAANYRDPFLGTLPKSRKAKSKRQVKAQELPDKEVTYSGFITDNNTNKKIFFISVDGQQQMLSKREQFHGVTLLSGDENKIKIKYNGKTRSVSISQ